MGKNKKEVQDFFDLMSERFSVLMQEKKYNGLDLKFEFERLELQTQIVNQVLLLRENPAKLQTQIDEFDNSRYNQETRISTKAF